MPTSAENCFILFDFGFRKPLQSTLQVGQLISTKGLFTLAFHRKNSKLLSGFIHDILKLIN